MKFAALPSLLKLLVPFMVLIPILVVITGYFDNTTILADDVQTSIEITPEDGGELISPDSSVRLVFPPRSVNETVEIIYTSGLQTPQPSVGWSKIGPSFELVAHSIAKGQEVTEFKDVEISILYDPKTLPDPRLASIRYWHKDKLYWAEIPTLHKVNESGQPILWARINHLDIFAPMASEFIASNVVVLDVDPNDGCVRSDPNVPCLPTDYIELNRSIYTILQTKKLLEACGVTVLLTFDPDNLPSPIPPGWHPSTKDERAQMIADSDASLTVAYNTHNRGAIANGLGGAEPWYFDEASLSSENEVFADNLLVTIANRVGSPLFVRRWQFGYGPGVSKEVYGIDPLQRYAHIELAFLTLSVDKFFIDSDQLVPLSDISALRNTYFAFSMYSEILSQLNRTDCLCLPDSGLSINNKPRLEDLIEITDVVYTEDGVEYAYVVNNSNLLESFRLLNGEGNISYPLDPGVTVTGYVSLPFTSTLMTTGVSQNSGVYSVDVTSTLSETTSAVIPNSYADINTGEEHILRPIQYSFLNSVFRYGAGFMPWQSDQDYTLEQLEALEAGSCQGMCTLTAMFCTGRLSPAIFGASSPGGVTDNGLASNYLNYYQLIQVYLAGTNVTANEFFDIVETRIANGQWATEPYLLRLAYKSPDSCNVLGHVVYPYMVQTIGSTREMYVYDPNYPENNNIKVTLDSNGQWSYPFSPSVSWNGNEVNYISLNEIPAYGTAEGDLIDENTLYVQAEALEYGGWPRASYGTGSWATTSYGGWPRASYGTDENGNRMGYEYDESGQLICHSDINNATYLSYDLGDLPGVDWRPPHIMVLPKNNYVFTLGEPTVGGVHAATIYGHNAMYTFNATSEDGTYDEFEINANLNVVTHTTTMDAQALSSTLSRESEDWTRMFGISHTPLLAGETIIYRVDSNNETLEYVNLGTNKTYYLGLAQIDHQGIGMNEKPRILIEAGDRHVITACNWNRLDTSILFLDIDHGNDGVIDVREILTDFPLLLKNSQQKISALAVDGYDYWIGTPNDGLIHYSLDTNTLSTYNTSNSGLPRNKIQDVVIAPNGDVWVATSRGATRFDGNAWQTFDKNTGLPNNNVNAIATSPSGLVWVATNRGIARYDSGIWTIYTKGSGLPHNNVRAATVDANENLWVLTVNGIVAKYSGSLWTIVQGLPNGSVDAMTSGNGAIWFAHNKGLVKYEGGIFTNVSTGNANLDEVAFDSVGMLCNSNMIWVVTEDGDLGLYAHDNDSWLVLP